MAEPKDQLQLPLPSCQRLARNSFTPPGFHYYKEVKGKEVRVMKWKQLKAISAAGALSMAMLATGVAQNAPAADSAPAPATTTIDSNAPARGHMRGLEQLNLSDQQKAQIQAIRAKARAKATAVKNDNSLSDAQKQANLHRIHHVARRRVFRVLTVEQRQQLRAQMRQHHQQMEQQKQQPGPNNG
jgi:Spy/CpxP family protein refolding chaperone